MDTAAKQAFSNLKLLLLPPLFHSINSQFNSSLVSFGTLGYFVCLLFLTYKTGITATKLSVEKDKL